MFFVCILLIFHNIDGTMHSTHETVQHRIHAPQRSYDMTVADRVGGMFALLALADAKHATGGTNIHRRVVTGSSEHVSYIVC